MNKVFESNSMVVHDDRDFISSTDAINILLKGGAVTMSDPPDYSTESEAGICGASFTVTLNDIVDSATIERMSESDIRHAIYEHLRGYDLSL
jgi:hypothetical protein